jgi:proteasome accessory factor C
MPIPIVCWFAPADGKNRRAAKCKISLRFAWDTRSSAGREWNDGMDRFTRILLLHRILASARRPVPRRELQDRLECSAASIKRVIAEMRDYLGAPLEYDREANGYYYADHGGGPYELPGLWFSASELLALVSLHTLLEGLGPGLLDQSLRPLRARLDQLLGSDGAGLVQLPRRIRILAPGQRLPEPDGFRLVAAATLQRRRLRVVYHARGTDTRAERELSPQRLVFHRYSWYLEAWCHLRDQIRVFAVERLWQVTVLDVPAREVPDDVLDAHAGGYGIFGGPARDVAVLRFESVTARWISEERWHPEQEGTWLPDGRYELRLPYAEPTELVMDILRYGPDIDVVAPESLRDLVRERLAGALARYQPATGSDFEPPRKVEIT